MKRKLVLTFEDNKLLHATITERGRRTRLPKIATCDDAVKEVQDALVCAMTAVNASEVSNASSQDVVIKLPENGVTKLPENVVTKLPDNIVTDVSASVPPEEETASVAEMQEAPRARSVCARPKSDKKEVSSLLLQDDLL